MSALARARALFDAADRDLAAACLRAEGDEERAITAVGRLSEFADPNDPTPFFDRLQEWVPIQQEALESRSAVNAALMRYRRAVNGLFDAIDEDVQRIINDSQHGEEWKHE